MAIPGTPGLILPNVMEDGATLVVPELSNLSRTTIFSQNFCDKTTWYYNSARVIAEVLIPNGDRTIFSSANSNWIDLTHGKVSDEDDFSASYSVIVYVDGVEQTEDTPFGSNNDYSVNYATGEVTFHQAVAGGGNVTATYSHENGSEWILAPKEGKILTIESAESQFSQNIDLNSTVVYDIYGYVQIFAPPLMNPPSSLPVDTQILLKRKVYKNALDFVNESNGVYPIIPAFGGATRGLSQDIITLPWNYRTRTDLYSSYGMEIRVSIENDMEFGGDLCVVTFYCVSKDEEPA